MTVAHADPRDIIFAGIADRTFTAAVIADDEGIVSPIAAAVEVAQEIGLEIQFQLNEAGHVSL